MNTTALSPTPTIIRPAQILEEICKELGKDVPTNAMYIEKFRVRNNDIIISAPENALGLIKEFLLHSGVEIEDINEYSFRVLFVS